MSARDLLAEAEESAQLIAEIGKRFEVLFRHRRIRFFLEGSMCHSILL
jgi:hypothetical protein